jgi:hypothetical protein
VSARTPERDKLARKKRFMRAFNRCAVRKGSAASSRFLSNPDSSQKG